MINLYVVRHGSTDLAENNILQGHLHNPINKKGFSEVLKVSQKLKNIHFNSIFSSDLKRAVQTAEIIKKNVCFKGEVQKTRLLRELDFGDFTGKYRTAIMKKCPKLFRDVSFKCPNGESYLDLKDRVSNFLHRLIKKENGNLLIVTHRGCIVTILGFFGVMDFEENLSLEVSHESVYKFTIEEGTLIAYAVL